MKITILTLFPEMFKGPFDLSILKKARGKKLLELSIRNIRDFGIGRHKLVDDTPYGGGVGMVMRVDVLHKAIESVKENLPKEKQKVVLLSARGRLFNQSLAKKYADLQHLLLVCGHYEGVDERITKYIDEELSVGDVVTTGGEIPAMIVTDAVSRLIPGVLKQDATLHESFSLFDKDSTLLEYPHFTSPREYDSQKVPEILLSGDHKKIALWQHDQAKRKTRATRPDLLKKNPN